MEKGDYVLYYDPDKITEDKSPHIMLVASDPVLIKGDQNLRKYTLSPAHLPTDHTVRVIALTAGALSGLWNTRYLKVIPLEEIAILRMEGKIL